ncbi:MAG: DNA primase [Deltaproteobacteria bacterium]|nr:DNA primase [Deltaproteobacteria bacterium]
MISTETIEQVKSVAKLSDVVSEYTNLKKVGRQFSGLCPFHTEKTPSFYLDPTDTFYYCFGCGAKGNIFSFLKSKKALDFVSAVEFLARRYGIAVKYSQASSGKPRQFLVNQLALEIFRESFKQSSLAQTYFSKRGFPLTFAERFEIGYSPENSSRVAKALVDKGITLQELKEAGLIRYESNSGHVRDFFSGRLIFPIHDRFGNIIGFAGRTLSEDQKPKYINTPETTVFKKSKVLFGIKFFRTASENLYVVEGYFDVLRLLENHLNAVCSAGSSFSNEQLKLSESLAKTIYFVFDGDIAGLKSSLRTCLLTAGSSCNVQFILLPDGFDPDDFVKNHGAQGFLNLQAVKPEACLIQTFCLISGQKNFKEMSRSQLAQLNNLIQEFLEKITNPLIKSQSLDYFRTHFPDLRSRISQNNKSIDLDDVSFITLCKKYPFLIKRITEDPVIMGELPSVWIRELLSMTQSEIAKSGVSKLEISGKKVTVQEIVDFIRKTILLKKSNEFNHCLKLEEAIKAKKNAVNILLTSG